MRGIPAPADMLEELADKVLVHMDRLAVPSFRVALDELIDFHKFLMDAYTTVDDKGSIVSYAQIGYFVGQHVDWVREYRRLFERAAEFIGRENDFVEILAHTPLRLLPDDAHKTAPEVTVELLDLIVHLIYRLEAWVTRRLIRKQAEGQSQALRLPGSDARAYEDATVRIIGAWENILRRVERLYRWRNTEVAPDEQWRRLTSSWPLVQRHLRNTAHLVAVSVWNEDEIGASYYSDALIRWFTLLEHELEGDHHFPKPLHSPELFGLDWNAALLAITPLLYAPHLEAPRPEPTFAAVLKNAVADTKLILIGVVLDWFIQERQSTDIAVRTVNRLLAASPGLDQDGGITNFDSILRTLIRLDTAGPRFKQKGYGASLDGLVAFLDQMTERRVVPGRVYTPSTRHEREDLFLPWLVCLLATVPNASADIADRIGRLTEDEDAFADGDASLRGLIHTLKQWKGLLGLEQMTYLARGLGALRPDADLAASTDRLKSIFDECIAKIGDQRVERLQARSVDQGKLDGLRREIEKRILSDNGGIDIFDAFTILLDGVGLPVKRARGQVIGKGILTSPSMETEPGNLWEVTADSVRDIAVSHVWHDLLQRPQRVVEAADASSFWALLKAEAATFISAHRQPVLLLRGWKDPPWMLDWLRGRGDRPEDIQAHRRADIRTSAYLGTLNGIDVYRDQTLQPGESILFATDYLKAVRYERANGGNVVEVTFEEQENRTSGSLVFRFSQATEWTEDQVVILRYPAPPAEDTSG